jgi:hypothetical protein
LSSNAPLNGAAAWNGAWSCNPIDAMKLRLKEDPKEWRKAVWFGALGFGLLSSLLCWRGVLTVPGWLAILTALALIALTAALRPRWFRGYYRGVSWVGFHVGQVVGFVLLTAVFLLVLTPLGLVLRLAGKDLLRLRRSPEAQSYWSAARPGNSLDRLF